MDLQGWFDNIAKGDGVAIVLAVAVVLAVVAVVVGIYFKVKSTAPVNAIFGLIVEMGTHGDNGFYVVIETSDERRLKLYGEDPDEAMVEGKTGRFYYQGNDLISFQP